MAKLLRNAKARRRKMPPFQIDKNRWSWSAVMIKPSDAPKQKAEQQSVKSKFIGMGFTTLRDRILGPLAKRATTWRF